MFEPEELEEEYDSWRAQNDAEENDKWNNDFIEDPNSLQETVNHYKNWKKKHQDDDKKWRLYERKRRWKIFFTLIVVIILLAISILLF